MTSRSRVRTSAVAATAVAASAALLAGATLGPTAVQSAQSERTLVADPTLAASTGIAGGVAIDPEGIVTSIPIIGNGLWNGVWPTPGLKTQFGDSTAIAILPGAAIAAAAKGESATAFALGGLAIATTDVTLIGFEIPTGTATCLGVFAFASSSTNGMCVNVLGTFDADYNKKSGEISAALTNPVALLGILTGNKDPWGLVEDLIDGDPLSRILTDDFVRLTLGGPGFVKLTSDYAFQEYKSSGGGVVIGWLGGNLVLFPVVTGGGVEGSVNYIGLPKLEFADFPNISNIIPSLSFGEFKTPIFNIQEWSTNDFLGSNLSASTLAAAAEAESAPLAKSSAVPTPETQDEPVDTAPAPVETTPVAPEVQPEPEVEPTVTPEPVDPPAAVESTPQVESIPEVEAPSETESAGETSSLDGVDDAA